MSSTIACKGPTKLKVPKRVEEDEVRSGERGAAGADGGLKPPGATTDAQQQTLPCR
jgi:hypothetical protein